jgi:hypothetical protein
MTSIVSLWLLAAAAIYAVDGSRFDADLLVPAGARRSYDNGLMIEDLYQRLAKIDPSYFVEAEADGTPGGDYDIVGRAAAAGREAEEDGDGLWVKSDPRSSVAGGKADTRDSEYIGHSSNAASTGFIYMSGGAGEGKQHLTPNGALQNVHQVKSDEALPFYCHPPNPCPKGYTSKDGCQESVEDDADVQKSWIEKMMTNGLCSCDEEHMFDCPSQQQQQQQLSGSPQSDGQDKPSSALRNDAFDDIVLDLLHEQRDSGENNPYIGGQKRQTLVAKKSPRIKRDLSADTEMDKLKNPINNPYLSGEKLPTVAKKGFMKDHRSME